jgi:hypothetical protein
MKDESEPLPPIQHRSQLIKIGTPTEVDFGNVAVMPRTGLEFPSRMSFEKWLQIGRMLSAVYTSSAWCLGDWLVFGESRYNGRYRDAIDRTSLDYQTLRNYAWVARRFPLLRRRDTLSFGHHAEVAALSEPEQDFWLRKAETLSWSRNKLRREVKASLQERVQDSDGKLASAQTPNEPNAYLQTEWLGLHLKVTVEQFDRCRAMAAQADMSVEAWAIHMLDSASHRTSS